MKKFANRLLEIFKKGDMILLALCVASSVFGIVMIYAATYTEGNTRMIIIQTASLCAGILVYLGMTALILPSFARLVNKKVRRRKCLQKAAGMIQ